MRLLYGKADEKFVRVKEKDTGVISSALDTQKYTESPYIKRSPRGFDKNALPIVFKISPESLLNLAAIVVDKLPISSIYDWTVEDVCRWIRKYGYHHYQNTFRVNLVTGRKLLLIDAQALATMNIKNFKDIKHIAYGIRQLFHFEMTKFMRSISLPPQYYYELYKLFRTKTGYTFDQTKLTELFRRLQLLREKRPYLSHWETLERWLSRIRDPANAEIIGGTPHYRLYWCKAAVNVTRKFGSVMQSGTCTCIQPCDCLYTEVQLRAPTVFSLLRPTRELDDNNKFYNKPCQKCVPPCSCQWKANNYKFDTVISFLSRDFPLMYDLHRDRHGFTLSSDKFEPSVYDFF